MVFVMKMNMEWVQGAVAASDALSLIQSGSSLGTSVVNSALKIDLTGKVCANSIGHRIYSGIGGQMDFMRGAALSPRRKANPCAAFDSGKGHAVADCDRTKS